MPANATFYLSDPSMLGSRLFERVETIQAYESLSEGSRATGFLLKLGWGEVKINFMPQEQLASHLSGFEAYVKSQLNDENDLTYALSRLHYVRMCLGCTITHEKEAEDDAQLFLFTFNAKLNGLMFLYDSVWDWSCEALCGPHKNG